MPGPSRRAVCQLLGGGAWLASALAAGRPVGAAASPADALPSEAMAAEVMRADALPAEVIRALQREQLPTDALVAMVQPLEPLEPGRSAGGIVGGTSGRPRLAWHIDRPVNPASLMKLLTTAAGLELLGPAWRWATPVWLDGPVDAATGVLDGDLVIQGSGDPTLVLERLWLLLRRVQQAGVRQIRGDIVLDRSAFRLPPHDPAAFDGEPYRPSNAGPDALLINYRSIVAAFMPDAAAGSAAVTVDLPLAGVRVDGRVPLSSAACDDWQAALQADFSDPARIRFSGRYPVACGEKRWPIAYADPAHFEARALAGLWQEMGGRLGGAVRSGAAPARPPTFEALSPPLADVVRDINKFSNNLMAEQLFLTLARVRTGVGTPEAARELLSRWAVDRLGAAGTAGMVIDNGSGLSRDGRLTARLLARLLQAVATGPLMPEWIASLPLSGIDGTLRRAPALPGRAHLKTGSLRDVSGIAGVLLADSGRRHAVVAVVNHPDAYRAGAAFDALIRWAADDAGRAAAAGLPARNR